jgi:hypothetical protein
MRSEIATLEGLCVVRFTNPWHCFNDDRSSNIRGQIMTISSVSAPPPVSAPVIADTASPDAKNNAASGNTDTWQPPAKSPLPPGQGTRIDQLV